MKGWGWAALLAAGLVLVASRSASASVSPLVDTSPPKRVSVGNRWAAAGVHPSLQQLLDDWEYEGWFDVQVGLPFAGFPGGGLRTPADAAGQTAACIAGLSNACDLMSTPHGRGAALDIWPAGFDPLKTYDAQPGSLDAMKAFGQWAESKGFTWGGRWKNPDFPHVEITAWRSLPYPPPNGGYWA